MIAWFATKGSGTNEALRIKHLLSGAGDCRELDFDKKEKRKSFIGLLSAIWRLRPRLIVMEGTGIAGGIACLLARILLKIPYIVSSGDAVGPFVASHRPGWGWIFTIYERALCRNSAGFIGWTPYLVGRALTFGAPRAMTAPGWVIGNESSLEQDREQIRRRLGIVSGQIVFGILGALEWNTPKKYCYGLELVEAINLVKRKDVTVVIVGGGSGYAELKKRAGRLNGRVIMPGPVALADVMKYLAAFDVASLPQSLDQLGMFRYTTKISEYVMSGLPVVTSRIPAAYDLDNDWIWRLPGKGPWEKTYIEALAALMENITRDEIDLKRKGIPAELGMFDSSIQIKRVGKFIRDTLEDEKVA
jgi:hypothetical protein